VHHVSVSTFFFTILLFIDKVLSAQPYHKCVFLLIAPTISDTMTRSMSFMPHYPFLPSLDSACVPHESCPQSIDLRKNQVFPT